MNALSDPDAVVSALLAGLWLCGLLGLLHPPTRRAWLATLGRSDS